MKNAETYISHFLGERSERIEKAITQLQTLVAFHDKHGKHTPKKVEKMERVKKLILEIQAL